MKMSNQDTLVKELKKVDSFNERAANLFVSIIQEAIKEKGKAYVAVSGGSTPIPIYQLIRDKFIDQVSWENVSFFWVDERCVPPDHPNSNYGNAKKEFLDFLPNVNTYRMKGEYPDERAVNEYTTYLKEILPSSDGIPCFDLIWLGMGTDGHTASIFPNSEAIHENKKWVKRVWIDKLDTHRLTLTFPVINNAKKRMIVLRGSEKFKVFKEIQNKETKKYPIQYILPSEAKDYWIIGKN